MAKRRQPPNWSLVSPTGDAFAHLSIVQPDAEFNLRLLQAPLTRDEIRADELQMFVARDEEDYFVTSFHFPVIGGKARQVKLVVPIAQLFTTYVDKLPDALPIETGKELVTQLVIEFEQICINFMLAALPRLRNMAVELTPLRPKRTDGAPTSPSTTAKSGDDGKEEFIVNRSSGWPMIRPRFKLHDIVRLPYDLAKRDVEAGYLVRAKDVEDNIDGWGAEYRVALATYRVARERNEKVQIYRPKPTDMKASLQTSAGRKARKQIAAEIAKIIDVLFEPPVGRPLSRTPLEKATLIAELRTDLNRRRAVHVRRGIRKTVRAVYQEMAEHGQYGLGHESLTAANIEYLLKKSRSTKRE